MSKTQQAKYIALQAKGPLKWNQALRLLANNGISSTEYELCRLVVKFSKERVLV